MLASTVDPYIHTVRRMWIHLFAVFFFWLKTNKKKTYEIYV